jgi:hypothetical protein
VVAFGWKTNGDVVDQTIVPPLALGSCRVPTPWSARSHRSTNAGPK